MKKSISIVLSMYNGQSFLKQQLESIAAQSVLCDELILLDDQSADGTRQIAADFLSSHPHLNGRLEVNERNLGYIRSFRKGLSIARGDIVVLCDQDDLWPEDRLETISRFFEEKNPGGLVGSFVSIDQKGNPIDGGRKTTLLPFPDQEEPIQLEWKHAAYNNAGPGCTMAFSKPVVQTCLHLCQDETLPHDWALAATALLESNFWYVPAVVTEYRQHGSNTLGLGRKTGYEDRLKQARQTKSHADTLLAMVQSYPDHQAQAAFSQKVCKLRTRRLKALEKRSIWQLAAALPASLSLPAMAKTLGLDIVVLIKDKLSFHK